MGVRPPFLGPRAYKRRSRAASMDDKPVWYDPDDRHEYDKCPKRGPNQTYHRIDWRGDHYQDIDRETGQPVAGRRGEWRPLR